MSQRIMQKIGLISTLLTLTATTVGRAQESGWGLSLVGGGSSYDLSGTGTGAVVAARAEIGVASRVIVEPGLGFYRYDNQGGSSSKYLLPEVSVQFEPLSGMIRPYVGAGGGAAAAFGGGTGSAMSLHAAAGVRVRVAPSFDVKGELRVRSIDPWVGSTADYTGGVSIRL